MIWILIMTALVIYGAAIFILRYFIGVMTFWGKQYLKQGYQILRSDRSSFYLLDTATIYGFSAICLFAFRYHLSLSQIVAMDGLKSLLFLLLLILLTFPLRKNCVFYDGHGLLIIKPFKGSRHVPWSEIGSIQKRRSPQKYHIVLDQDGKRLTIFSLNRKTKRFIDLAQQNRVSLETGKWI